MTFCTCNLAVCVLMASYSAILGFERPSHRNFRTSISRGVKESKASSAFLQSSDWLDYIWAYDGDDIIDGGDGNDAIAGAKGDDYAVGGSDNNVIHGSLGSDVLIGGDARDFWATLPSAIRTGLALLGATTSSTSGATTAGTQSTAVRAVMILSGSTGATM
jgi:RTX calcium-binding nonapeptide repeat (4 copies)